MNTTAASSAELCDGVRQGVDDIAGVEKVVCPPFPFLFIACDRLKGSSVKVGAQNMHWVEKGAYTGEVSHSMLAGLVEYVIIGHSERRAYFCETDETVNKKLAAALAAGLKPIFCVGETESEREAGRTEEVLLRQVRIGLEGIQVPEGFAIAYEPVWAIGTGKPATGPMANEAAGLIRAEVARLAGAAIAGSARILYGGSVTPDNMTEFARQPEIDGGLVGGASLNAESFISLVRQTAEATAAKQ
jgi:triosephosphate isomerase